MKTLYLVRHAKSSWKNQELDDIDRPLNKRGKRDAPEMGNRLAQRGVFPDLMVSSPAVRAFRTCEIFAKILEFPNGAIETNRDVYHATERDLLAVVRASDDLWKTLMLFGHNPELTSFANALTNEDIENIPTCGVFACTFDVYQWDDVDFGTGKKLLYDYPKKEFSL